jgi:hypothetical protein
MHEVYEKHTGRFALLDVPVGKLARAVHCSSGSHYIMVSRKHMTWSFEKHHG